ncbi:hypothetical protein A2Z33_07340 [Candidatus Gottesmanbacteria bacterium RBG_16_52_11]|uniref:Uncharacterized protein n=1 Tax=Candidatus Gottesmanbacteria bacterium RBG_16_52_11 TaxID=1798374 RepID=A0A1F5YY56_9BACT|nr:MAG: hypothetical protein A2Z33_07340 [Candidatus Gottesmanbacteria bacterium RBG_16_52_11]
MSRTPTLYGIPETGFGIISVNMNQPKSELLRIVRIITSGGKLTVNDISTIMTFTKPDSELMSVRLLKITAVPLSLFFGFLFAVFPDEFVRMTGDLPAWTNLSPRFLTGVDYLWNILGEPVKKSNIIYHLPNVILYSFGFVGAKKLFDAIDRHTWLDRVRAVQQQVRAGINSGTLNLRLRNGHSVLFTGKGDFIGMQYVTNLAPDEAVTLSESKPGYTDIWNSFDSQATYKDLYRVLGRVSDENTGEYVFFPVRDDQIFLPSPDAYDLSPYKLDILCQNIRQIENAMKLTHKRIIIVGDREHRSLVRSEDRHKVIRKSEEVITLDSIAAKYRDVTIIDPTDIVLKYLLSKAGGRRIVFRATADGIRHYKARFYRRLIKSGYSPRSGRTGILTVGYDITEDQTEQQALRRTADDYFPVVLSMPVRDALVRNAWKTDEFLYVPDMVLETLRNIALQQ